MDPFSLEKVDHPFPSFTPPPFLDSRLRNANHPILPPSILAHAPAGKNIPVRELIPHFDDVQCVVLWFEGGTGNMRKAFESVMIAELKRIGTWKYA